MKIVRPIFFLLLVHWTCPGTERFKVDVAQVDPALIEARLKQCERGNKERGDRLRVLFEKTGCPYLTEQSIEDFKLPNIICKLPGSAESVILVGAHYDHSTSYGRGVIDNWSGAALLPSLLQSLQNSPRKHTYLFIGFAGEEKGLLGSRHFVKQIMKEPNAKIKAMINLDCLGLSSTKVEVNRGDPKLIQYLHSTAIALGMSLEGMNVDQVGSTDSYPFMNAKIPSVSIHSVTPETLKVLHSVHDQLNAVRMTDYVDTFRLVAFYLASLDQLLPE